MSMQEGECLRCERQVAMYATKPQWVLKAGFQDGGVQIVGRQLYIMLLNSCMSFCCCGQQQTHVFTHCNVSAGQNCFNNVACFEVDTVAFCMLNLHCSYVFVVYVCGTLWSVLRYWVVWWLLLQFWVVAAIHNSKGGSLHANQLCSLCRGLFCTSWCFGAFRVLLCVLQAVCA